jgi:hypothetical protein
MSGRADPVARARRILARKGAWIEATACGYAVRSGTDRRARVLATLDETELRALIAAPGLKPRKGGGWSLVDPPAPTAEAGPPGRPGVTEGSRLILRPDGVGETQRANLTTSPVAWLASRAGPDGQPWLTRAEVAAAELLGREAEAALRGASVTMRWDALPRNGAGGALRSGPGDRALAAGRRVEAALAACGPARAMVEHVCLRATALQAAEQSLGLRRRTGKAVLRQGLAALALHYRLD